MKKILYILSVSFLLFFIFGLNCTPQEKNINPEQSSAKIQSDNLKPRAVIYEVLVKGSGPYSAGKNYEIYNTIYLKQHQTDHLGILFLAVGFTLAEPIEFSWKLDGFDEDWSIKSTIMYDEGMVHSTFYPLLKPGKYKFFVRVRRPGEDWKKPDAFLIINVSPPILKTWWFWIVAFSTLTLLISLIFWWRIRVVKRKEREKFAHEKQILELEARALRAQMNPHFIFNCMNSIKSLMQEKEIDKGVSYLTTFSKLIRTLFNNADKKEISLYDEIETCKLYLQLEAMRFDAKFSYSVNVDETIDLKSIYVPALIIQPFIENAIWHGIIPKSSDGNVSLAVSRNNGYIEIAVEDNGIGREASKQNKAASNIGHQSKGVNLTQSRLELDNLLQQRQAKLETIDKKDENGKASGSKVIISLPYDE